MAILLMSGWLRDDALDMTRSAMPILAAPNELSDTRSGALATTHDHGRCELALANRPERLSRFVPETGPVLRCGHCGEIIRDYAPGKTVRCQSCQRRNLLPSAVVARCFKCETSQRVRLDTIATARLCRRCSTPLAIEDIPLQALHRRSRRRSKMRSGWSRNDHAIWMMLVFSVLLVIAVKVLIPL